MHPAYTSRSKQKCAICTYRLTLSATCPLGKFILPSVKKMWKTAEALVGNKTSNVYDSVDDLTSSKSIFSEPAWTDFVACK